MKAVLLHEILDHGVEHAQFFQGCGVSLTEYDECFTGTGETPAEALDDAIENAAQSDWDMDGIKNELPTETPDELKPSDEDEGYDRDERYCYVSIRLKKRWPAVSDDILSTVGGQLGEELPAFAWPGGSTIAYYNKGGDPFCAKCAAEHRWLEAIEFAGTYDEGPTVECTECDAKLEATYGDPEEDGHKEVIELIESWTGDALVWASAKVTGRKDDFRGKASDLLIILEERLHQEGWFLNNYDITEHRLVVRDKYGKPPEHPGHADKRDAIKLAGHYNLPEPPDGRWSNARPIPSKGERVRVVMNGLGWGTVVDYFYETGTNLRYVGVAVALEAPPEWFVKQNNGNIPALVYGSEIE